MNSRRKGPRGGAQCGYGPIAMATASGPHDPVDRPVLRQDVDLADRVDAE